MSKIYRPFKFFQNEKDQEALTGENIFIKDQRYRQISDSLIDVVFDLFIETRVLQLIALLSNF